MPVQAQKSLDFTSPEVCAFLAGSAMEYTEELDVEALIGDGYVAAESGGKQVARSVGSGPNLKLPVGRVERHIAYVRDATTGAQTVLGGFNNMVPYLIEVEVSLSAALFLRDSLQGDLRGQLVTAFEQFDLESPVPVEDYFGETTAALGVRPSDVHVLVAVKLRKTAPHAQPVAHHHDATQHPDAETPGDFYFERVDDGDEYVCPFTPTATEEMPTTVEVDSDPEHVSEDEVTHLAREHSRVPDGCTIVEVATQRITTLFQYPEFMVRPYRTSLKIGCVYIVLYLPRLEVRTAKRVLYGSAPSSFNTDALIAEPKDCLVQAANKSP